MKLRRMISMSAFCQALLCVWLSVFFPVGVYLTQAAPSYVQAVNVRGLIMRQVNNRKYPAARMRVRLKRAGSNESGQIAYTATDGMYSFRNVAPGSYAIEVLGGAPERVLRSLVVQVPNRPTLDAPPIIL